MPGFLAGWLGFFITRVFDFNDARGLGLTWDEWSIVAGGVAFIYSVSVIRDLQLAREAIQGEFAIFKRDMDSRFKPRIVLRAVEKIQVVPLQGEWATTYEEYRH